MPGETYNVDSFAQLIKEDLQPAGSIWFNVAVIVWNKLVWPMLLKWIKQLWTAEQDNQIFL